MSDQVSGDTGVIVALPRKGIRVGPWFISLMIEPRDKWIGLYGPRMTQHTTVIGHHMIEQTWYLCILPCLPILFSRVKVL